MNDNVRQVTQMMTRLGTPSRLRDQWAEAIGDMGIAEQEIAAAVLRHPDRAEAIQGMFVSLARPKVLQYKAEQLYRSHVRELLERAATAGEIDFITRAEAVAVLSDMTFKSRLIPDAEHLYLRLFHEIGMELPGEQGVMEEADRQFNWNLDGQNRVFTQIARHLDTERQRARKDE